jgi:hypothetical protein
MGSRDAPSVAQHSGLSEDDPKEHHGVDVQQSPTSPIVDEEIEQALPPACLAMAPRPNRREPPPSRVRDPARNAIPGQFFISSSWVRER